MTGNCICRKDGLPYDMGNAGDLLKHGVLAEFVRWRQGVSVMASSPLRFFDFFGGKPWEENAHQEVVRRVQSLTDTALLEAQPEIAQERYYGSSHLVWQAAENVGVKSAQIYASDSDAGRARKLRNSGLFPVADIILPSLSPNSNMPPYDGYDFFDPIAASCQQGDLALVDPFGDFLPRKSGIVIPQIAVASKKATVVLFALNLDPGNRVGQRFDALLKTNLPNALKMTCPPIGNSTVKGEGTYYADVVLAAPSALEVDGLQTQLSAFTEKLAAVLDLPDEQAEMLKPKIIGRDT